MISVWRWIQQHVNVFFTVIFLVIGAGIIWRYGETLLPLLRDQEALQVQLRHLGWWGPAVLISVNILQIVLAPIPGYAVYLAAGYLYGAWWGGIWGSVGLLSGGMTAMLVGRRLGRPLVQRIIGAETLKRWEVATHSDSWLVWGAILLSPIGDAPFLLAGLSRVSYVTILVLTVVTRVPAAFAAAAIGAGSVHLTWWQITLIIIALAVPLILLHRYQARLVAAAENLVQRLLRRENQS